MTYAEKLLKKGREEGERKGRQEERLETVERLLELGVAWKTVREATGVDESSLAVLRRQVSRP